MNISLDMADDTLVWLKTAPCTELPLEDYVVFFPPHSQSGNTIRRSEVCGPCPHRVECITMAYENNIEFGYFAEMSPHARARYTLEQAVAIVTGNAVDDTPESEDVS